MSEILYVGALADDLSEVTKHLSRHANVTMEASIEGAIRRVEQSSQPIVLISCELVDSELGKYRRLNELVQAKSGRILINTFGRGSGKLGDEPLSNEEYVRVVLSEFGIPH